MALALVTAGRRPRPPISATGARSPGLYPSCPLLDEYVRRWSQEDRELIDTYRHDQVQRSSKSNHALARTCKYLLEAAPSDFYQRSDVFGSAVLRKVPFPDPFVGLNLTN
jgi:hypothetical protein